MASSETKRRWGRVLRYTVAGAICLLTAVAAAEGLQWYWSVIGLCGVVLLILGRRRIFRAGVTRTTDEIVCRYIPWYEGNAYFVNLVLPMFGVAMVAAGYAPGNPAWIRYGGFALLGLTPVLVFSVASMWRRGYLRISPSALTVRLAASKGKPAEIRRECVQAITPKMLPNSVHGVPIMQVEISYHAGDSRDDETRTVVIGLQLTVEPFNLLSALTAWKDFGDDGPSELLDRVEGALRERSTTGM